MAESPRASILPGARPFFDEAPPPRGAPADERPISSPRMDAWDDIERQIMLLANGKSKGFDFSADFVVDRIKKELSKLREKMETQAVAIMKQEQELSLNNEDILKTKHLDSQLSQANQLLQEKENEMTRQLEEDDEQIMKLHAQIEEKERVLRQQEAEIREAYQQIKEAREEKEKLDRKLELTRDEQRKSSEQHAHQWKEMATKTQLCQSQLELTTQELDKHKQQASEFIETVKEKDQVLQAVRARLEETNRELQTAQKTYDELQQEVCMTSVEQDALQKEHDDVLAELKAAQEKSKDLLGQQNEYDMQLSENENQANSLQKQLDILSQSRAQVDQNAAVDASRIKELQDQVNRMKAEESEARNSVEAIQRDMEGARAEHQMKVEDLERVLRQKRAELDANKDKLERLRAEQQREQSHLQGQNASLQETLQNTMQKELVLKRRLDELSKNELELQQTIQDLEGRVAQANTQVGDAQSNLNQINSVEMELTKQLEAALQDNARVQNQLRTLEQKSMAQQAAEDELKMQVEACKKMVETQNSQSWDVAQQKLNSLSKHLCQIEDNVQEQQKELEELRATGQQPENGTMPDDPGKKLIVEKLMESLVTQTRDEMDGDRYRDRNTDRTGGLVNKIDELEAQLNSVVAHNQEIQDRITMAGQPQDRFPTDSPSVPSVSPSAMGGGYGGARNYDDTRSYRSGYSKDKDGVLDNTDSVLHGARSALERLDRVERCRRPMGAGGTDNASQSASGGPDRQVIIERVIQPVIQQVNVPVPYIKHVHHTVAGVPVIQSPRERAAGPHGGLLTTTNDPRTSPRISPTHSPIASPRMTAAVPVMPPPGGDALSTSQPYVPRAMSPQGARGRAPGMLSEHATLGTSTQYIMRR